MEMYQKVVNKYFSLNLLEAFKSSNSAHTLRYFIWYFIYMACSTLYILPYTLNSTLKRSILFKLPKIKTPPYFLPPKYCLFFLKVCKKKRLHLLWRFVKINFYTNTPYPPCKSYGLSLIAHPYILTCHL